MSAWPRVSSVGPRIWIWILEGFGVVLRCRKWVVLPRFSRVFGSGFGLKFLRIFGGFAKLGMVSFPMVFG